MPNHIKEPCLTCMNRKTGRTDRGGGDRTQYCGITGKDIIGPNNGEPCVNQVKAK